MRKWRDTVIQKTADFISGSAIIRYGVCTSTASRISANAEHGRSAAGQQQVRSRLFSE